MIKTKLNIPHSFLKGRVICGEEINTQKANIWAIELDMLNEFACFCEKHNIKWFCDGGTLLGAIRHKGFIPWDDDIDVMMLREDYDKFISLSKDYFKPPYFLQTDWTDETYYCHGKLRRSDTTAILEKDLDVKFQFNQGVFIDIFPFDKVPMDENERKCFCARLLLLKNEVLIARLRWWLYERDNIALYNHLKDLRSEYDWLRRMYNNTDSINIANLSIPEHGMIDKTLNDFKETEMVDFEFLKVPVPKNYDRILINQYGNYMDFIKNASCHGEVIFDIDKSYKEYIL